MKSNTRDYAAFIAAKTHLAGNHGFEPLFMPEILFPFQQALIEWACVKGRAAIFADCGLGKTMMQLTWAQNVIEKTNGRVLILTPLAVAFQTVNEGKKIGVDVAHIRNPEGDLPKIVVTNYERLHLFDPSDFVGVVCDESSILKHFGGATRIAVTAFLQGIPYRLLCTATAAPNDYLELGTSSEALGVMERKHMLSHFFTHDSSDTGNWALKGHARSHLFWRWVCSWARAVRKPSDMGFNDGGFNLPPLHMLTHTVFASKPRDGYLLDIPAVGLEEQREDLKNTVNERCEMAASLINKHASASIAWCHLNHEGDTLAKLIDGAEQVSGSDDDDRKESIFEAFIRGDIRVLVSKPKIAGFGLNFQHCAHQTYFVSHSFEAFYQSVRRSWRFGQDKPVTIDIITTDGQQNVLQNLERKTKQASDMFESLVSMMWSEINIEQPNKYTQQQVTPLWL